MKVLIVDDGLVNRQMLESLLTGLKHEVVNASDGIEALERLRDSPADLIISDILMPRMDGFQLCREVRSDPALRDTPLVIYTSTYTAPEDEAFALELGADAFLLKPMELPRFMEEIQAVVQRSSHTKAPPEPARDLPEEQDYLREYNVRLINKLEQKVVRVEQLNRELREAHDLFSTLTQSSPVGIFMSDFGGRVLFANPSWSAMVGLAPEEWKSKSWIDRIHPEDRDGIEQQWQRARRQRKHFHATFRVLDSEESQVWVLGRAQPLGTEQGEPSGYIGTFTDITREKELEREKVELERKVHLAQKLEAMSTMIGGVAHDFNNLLGAMLGFAELLEAAVADLPKARSDLRYLRQAGKQAKDLVEQLLLFSRREEPELKPLNLAPLIRQALRLLRVSSPDQIRITEDCPSRLPLCKANAAQIHQILLNLVTNAVHALGDEEGTISVRVEVEAGKRLHITVSDDGPGIEGETLSRIFDPFFSTKPLGEGTGMGLAVVHGIVQAHDGEIRVSSTPGSGTSFTILLPIFEGEAESAAARSPIARGDGERILVVDDEDSLAQLTARLLEHFGHQVTVFIDPLQAWDAWEASPEEHALILIDAEMPGMSGLEFIQKARALRPEVKCVLMTGLPKEHSAEELRERGIARVMAKPFTMRILGETVHDVLHSDG